MQVITDKLWLSAVLLSVLFFSATLSAAVKVSDYRLKGDRILKTVETLHHIYPFSVEKKDIARNLKARWIDAHSDYETGDKGEKREAYKKIQNNYRRLKALSQSTAEDMRRYFSEISLNFENRLDHATEEEKPRREQYVHPMRVAQREDNRAERAYRSGRYIYASYTWHRNILIFARLHKKIGWSLPSAFHNLPEKELTREKGD